MDAIGAVVGQAPGTPAPPRGEDPAISSLNWLAFHTYSHDKGQFSVARVFNRLPSDDPVQRRAILEAMPQMAWSATADGVIDFYNARLRAFTGISDAVSGDHAWRTLIHPDDIDRVARVWRENVSSGADHEVECRLLHQSLGYRWISCRAAPIFGEDGAVLYWIGSCTDVHDNRLAVEALKESAALTRTIIQASADITILLDSSGKVIFANEAARGAARSEAPSVMGIHWRHFIPAAVHGPIGEAIEAAAEGRRSRFCVKEPADNENFIWHDVIATPILDEASRCRQILLIARDVTESRLQTEQIAWTANHDALTGLANRHAFNAALAQLLEGPEKSAHVGLILLDVDGFKLVNDTLGHDAGMRCFESSRSVCVRPCARATSSRGSAGTNSRSF